MSKETPDRGLEDRTVPAARVLVLRPEGQAEPLAELLEREGAEPVAIPAVRIVPPRDWSVIDSALDRLGSFGWLVFTSVNGAGVVLERLRHRGGRAGRLQARVAAIGPATRARLEQEGVTVDWMPSAYTTETLGAELPLDPSGRQGSTTAWKPSVCVVRADIASSRLEEILRQRGFTVERVNAYGTRPINKERIRDALTSVDAVALTSASIVQSFAAAVGANLPPGLKIFSIGPATSQACREVGLQADSEAEEHTVQGLVEALKKHGSIL